MARLIKMRTATQSHAFLLVLSGDARFTYLKELVDYHRDLIIPVSTDVYYLLATPAMPFSPTFDLSKEKMHV